MAERLTFDGNFCEIARCLENRWGKHCPDGSCSQRKVWERLKQYEDSDAVEVVRCKDCKHRDNELIKMYNDYESPNPDEARKWNKIYKICNNNNVFSEMIEIYTNEITIC